jgi:hypothetical protein
MNYKGAMTKKGNDSNRESDHKPSFSIIDFVCETKELVSKENNEGASLGFDNDITRTSPHYLRLL